MRASVRPDWDVAISAHPETSHPHVAVPILLVVLGTTLVVVLLATLVPARERPALPGPPDTSSWLGSLSRIQWMVRVLTVLALSLVVVAGRIGVDDELENLAPAATVGAGWSLLVTGSLVLGALWRWLDPWDTLARVLTPGDRSEPATHVWPAVVLTLPWLWFLGVYSRPLDPRAIGVALAAYSVVTVAGCLALGRVRWLSTAEPLGLLLSWIGLLPRRRLTTWEPPRGASALLGSIIGGLLFGVVRRTELWSGVLVRTDAVLWGTAALLGACAVGAGIGTAASRIGPPARRATVARALVPVAAGVMLAVALARNRFFTSIQLLPGLIGDPLGRGWDLLGTPTDGLDAAPLGAAGLVALQLGVAAGALLLAAATAPRTLVGDQRLPAIAVLAFFSVAAMWALSLH